MSPRYCRNCCRHTETDTIPAQQIGTYPVPAFTVCGYCGWATENRGDRMTNRTETVIAEAIGAGMAREGVRHMYVEDAPIVAKWVRGALNDARIATVELSEPAEREDGDEFTDFPALGVGLYVPVVFDQHPGEVQIRAGAWCDEPLSVDEARALAASILAAADAAEASQ